MHDFLDHCASGTWLGTANLAGMALDLYTLAPGLESVPTPCQCRHGQSAGEAQPGGGANSVSVELEITGMPD